MHLLGLPPIALASFCAVSPCGTANVAVEAHDLQNASLSAKEITDRQIFGDALVDVNTGHGLTGKHDRDRQFLGESLVVDVYIGHRSLNKARKQPKAQIHGEDGASWNTLIFGHIEDGKAEQALHYLKCMLHEGITPSTDNFAWILKACSMLGAIEQGAQVHDEIVRRGLFQSLGNALVDMYAKCGALGKAQQVLEELPSRTVVSWTALITGYAQNGEGENALSCLESMEREGIVPNELTYACVLKSCGVIRALDKGTRLHCGILKQDLLRDNVVLGTALVDMYAKCGDLRKAQQVLENLCSRDVISWTALIGGFSEQGHGEEAFNAFECMQYEGILPNAITYACTLKACSCIGAVERGRRFHDEMVKKGFLGNDIVLGNALVDMYARCRALEEARHVLEGLPFRDVISWNGLIAGLAQHGQGKEALLCFKEMQQEGLSPNVLTYACILKACGTMGDVVMGKQIHDEVERKNLLKHNSVLSAALIDMYVKCGDISNAEQALRKLPARDVVSWTALITGYADQGRGEDTLNAFELMQSEGILPNAVTFSCVLSMCSHLGLVELGHRYYLDMKAKYGITPNMELYTCMVDLFGRAGHLEKAVSIIKEMTCDSATWHALLGACRTWGDVNVGRWAFDQAVKINKHDVAAYDLMKNIYLAAGMEENAKNIEQLSVENEAL